MIPIVTPAAMVTPISISPFKNPHIPIPKTAGKMFGKILSKPILGEPKTIIKRKEIVSNPKNAPKVKPLPSSLIR